MDTTGIKELLYRNYEHPAGHVADRCLTCANCTMVCPTCF
jgi:Fe-S-cluster-containing hydrogenase component 2